MGSGWLGSGLAWLAGLAEWLRKEVGSPCGKAERPLLRHQRTMCLPLQRLFPSFIRLGSRTVISSSFSLDQATGGGWKWRLPSTEPSCRHCQSQSLPSSFLIPQSTIQHACIVCVCCTVHTSSSTSAIRLRSDAMRYDTMHCPLPCAPPNDGALALSAARVKHHEQAAVTTMTVSDEVDSCGSTSQALLAWAAGLAGWSGPVRVAGWSTTDG